MNVKRLIDWPWKKQGRASRINIRPPAAVGDRKDIAICAIMKNEALHLGDWLRFHAIAGVRNYILYDNGSTDESAEIALSVPGLNVTVIPWEFNGVVKTPSVLLPQQIIAYCHAIATYGRHFRWMAFIDIDEVLVPKIENTLLDALAPLSEYSNVSLPWTMYGPGGHDTAPAEPAYFAFLERAAEAKGNLLKFKCIVDPCKVTQVSVHKFVTEDMGEKSVNDIGVLAHYKQRETSGFLSISNIQLNHYYTRSRQEMAVKIASSAVSLVSQEKRGKAIIDKAAQIEANKTTDRSAVDFLARQGFHSAACVRAAEFATGKDRTS